MTDFSPGNHTVNCYMTMNSGNPDVYASFTAGNGTHNQCSFSSAGRWVWVIVDGVITSHCACANQAANAQNNHSGTMSNISEQWPA